MIHLMQPSVGDEELAALSEVFASGWLGHGPRTAAFEAAFADHVGVPAGQMIAINCATAGLFLAMQLLEVGAGDEVVLPSIAFLSAANAVAARGARPVFCDVDPHTLNPRPADIEAALGPRTRAVIILHYGGYPGQVAAIAAACRAAGVVLVEDAACSPASRVDGRACGTFGDLAVWSFDATKVLTTGDGGMLYVRDPALAGKARRLAYHGLTQPSDLARLQTSRRWWEFDLAEFGDRRVGNDLTSAIGLVQLRRLPELLARRRQVVERYDRELSQVAGLRLPPPLPSGHESSYFFYWVQLPVRIRDAVAGDLYRAGVYTTFKYAPLHRIPAYGWRGRLPGAERAEAETLCLPLHPNLDETAVKTVVTELRRAIESRLGAPATG
ncbi:MAG TPA: DegT/DnrJ/EryC1/StrS family aminotransferase [Natronosporangium sp.]